MKGPSVAATPTGTVTDSPVRRILLPLAPRRLEVLGVSELSATLRRITLGGPDLRGFATHGPVDHAKVFFPGDRDTEPVMPIVEDGRWTNRADPGLIHRDYTVRTFAQGSDTLVLDMVAGEHGPAARWAARARPGQALGVLGPRGSAVPPLDRAWYLLAADETGIPALLNWLDRLPASAYVRGFVEVGRPGDEVDLPHRDHTDVTWLYRGDTPAGTTSLLPDAVAHARFGTGSGSPAGLGRDRTAGGGVAGGSGRGGAVAGGHGRDGGGVAGANRSPDADAVGWVWAGAEASSVRAIRRHLRERGLTRDSFDMTGYWRAGVANFDHHSPDA